jgi:hypothetical protein
MRRVLAILLAALGSGAPVAAQGVADEVVIADAVDFGFTVAVYVDASRGGVPKQRFYRVDTLERTVGCLELGWDKDHAQYDVVEPQDDA